MLTGTGITYTSKRICYTCMHLMQTWTSYVLANTSIMLLSIHVNADTDIHVKHTYVLIDIRQAMGAANLPSLTLLFIS